MNGAADDLQRARRLSVLSVFTSSATLICCALPATLVAIGSAATLVSLLTRFPQLIWLSEHKAWVFSVAGALLFIGGGMLWRMRRLPCPADPALAAQCAGLRRQTMWVYGLSLALYLVGVAFAFVIPLWM